jgi:hypothetical protein
LALLALIHSLKIYFVWSCVLVFAKKQNIFYLSLTLLSTEIKIPILVVGPPVCAKTLSFSIAVDNMRGKQSNKQLYKHFHNIHPFRYLHNLLSIFLIWFDFYLYINAVNNPQEQRYYLEKSRRGFIDFFRWNRFIRQR